jgi:hypothetical protein
MSTSNITQSIWKQTNHADWKLIFDINKENNTNNTTETSLKQILDTCANKKKLKMGSLVMTPKGIGRLIKLEDGLATIKLQKEGELLLFPEYEIEPEFNIFICLKSADISNWYRLRIPANGTVETIKQLIQEMNIIDMNQGDHTLIYNGSEAKEELFLDQLDVRANSKFLLCHTKMTQYKITRYTNTYTWWYLSNSDGITFSVNKKIKLGGLGLYGSHENKLVKGTLKVFEGTFSDRGTCYYEEPFEIPAAPDQNNCITVIQFKKPITCKNDIDYTIQIDVSEYCYIYYGSGAKATIDGDKNVIFNFKYTPGSSFGSGVESGNYPEFYYYA